MREYSKDVSVVLLGPQEKWIQLMSITIQVPYIFYEKSVEKFRKHHKNPFSSISKVTLKMIQINLKSK
jgi:hypothetical protein